MRFAMTDAATSRWVRSRLTLDAGRAVSCAVDIAGDNRHDRSSTSTSRRDRCRPAQKCSPTPPSAPFAASRSSRRRTLRRRAPPATAPLARYVTLALARSWRDHLLRRARRVRSARRRHRRAHVAARGGRALAQRSSRAPRSRRMAGEHSRGAAAGRISAGDSHSCCTARATMPRSPRSSARRMTCCIRSPDERCAPRPSCRNRRRVQRSRATDSHSRRSRPAKTAPGSCCAASISRARRRRRMDARRADARSAHVAPRRIARRISWNSRQSHRRSSPPPRAIVTMLVR